MFFRVSQPLTCVKCAKLPIVKLVFSVAPSLMFPHRPCETPTFCFGRARLTAEKRDFEVLLSGLFVVRALARRQRALIFSCSFLPVPNAA
jgi:hypothetical protein